jgi:hypothetical protein
MGTKQYLMPAGNPSALSRITDQQNWEFYHYQTYAQAGQQRLTFFTAAPGSLKEDKYNMLVAGQLPAGFAFVLQEIMIDFKPGAAPGTFGAQDSGDYINDTLKAGNFGRQVFTVSQKVFNQGAPLKRYPMDVRMDGFAAAADSTTAGADKQTLIDYSAWVGRVNRVADLLIGPSQNFQSDLYWDTAAVPVSVAGEIGVILRGVLGRLVQ